jgi:hypothetical protein
VPTKFAQYSWEPTRIGWEFELCDTPFQDFDA